MRSQKVNCMFIILVSIVLLGPVQGAEDDDDDYKEPIEEYLEEDIAADILKPLGPLKSSRVLRTTYYLSRIEADWFSAKQHCVDNRLRLLSIEDLQEDSEITTFLNDERVKRVWTSGNDLDRNGHFVWSSTHRPMVYTNWHRFGIPKDPRLNCVFTGTDRYWGDGTWGWDESNCANRLKFICEEVL